jgi:hypothetical protein
MSIDRYVVLPAYRRAFCPNGHRCSNCAKAASTSSINFALRSQVRSFRAFAFFLEALEDLETFAAAVLFADSELCRQAEVFRLLFGTDADVNNRANHGSQISAVVLHGQVKHAVQL